MEESPLFNNRSREEVKYLRRKLARNRAIFLKKKLYRLLKKQPPRSIRRQALPVRHPRQLSRKAKRQPHRYCPHLGCRAPAKRKPSHPPRQRPEAKNHPTHALPLRRLRTPRRKKRPLRAHPLYLGRQPPVKRNARQPHPHLCVRTGLVRPACAVRASTK
jgi:hypothetical protein